jgi:glucose/arabinose dehydrogenase
VNNKSSNHFSRIYFPIGHAMRFRIAAILLVITSIQSLTPSRAAAADSKPGIALKKIAEGFVSPAVLLSLDASGRLLIGDQVGVVKVLNTDGTLLEKPFLSLADRMKELNKGFDERGLLGMALHPRFKENRKLYVCYSAPLRKDGPEGWDHTMNVSEFKVAENDALHVDSGSERVLLQIDKAWFNHNGGALAFGPDGFLYISVGDGGNANDEGRGHTPGIGNGQDLTNLMGKMLRIDVDKGNPYAIPSDNPFASGGGRPEIFAYGLRNSWRMSFDRGGSHELFAGEIGQNLFEEVNIIVKGGNYGWRIREGFHCFDPKSARNPPADCPKIDAFGKPLIDPIFEYKNVNGFKTDPEAIGVSVIGGYVYRGKALPHLQGKYVFADWSRSMVVPYGTVLVGTRPKEGSRWSIEQLPIYAPDDESLRVEVGKRLADAAKEGKTSVTFKSQGGKTLAVGPEFNKWRGVFSFIVSMGEDAEGELYLLTQDGSGLVGKTGKVYKLVPQ